MSGIPDESVGFWVEEAGLVKSGEALNAYKEISIKQGANL